MKIFIGYDSREPVAFHVLAHSIMRRASKPVEIVPLIQSQLRQCGLYTRERDPRESTEFSLTRFLVPYLSNYEGFSLYLDCDMLCLTDIEDIPMVGGKAVYVAQHDYTPKHKEKFLGQEQTIYPRKNWSSLMLFNNAKCKHLIPAYINCAEPLELHRFAWQDYVGSLPIEYNWLVGEYPKNPNAKILHFTNGGPWFPDYVNCDHADLWREEARHAGVLTELLFLVGC
jgi:lipopolysaccharide biosynthesis glycosyltransferase